MGNRSSHDVAGQEVKPDLKMSEADLKEVVISVAKRYGWLIHHDLPAQNSRGRWLTNVQGDAGSHFNSVWKPSDMEYILYTLSNFQL